MPTKKKPKEEVPTTTKPHPFRTVRRAPFQIEKGEIFKGKDGKRYKVTTLVSAKSVVGGIEIIGMCKEVTE